MTYINDKFKKVRLDQSPYLFHFVNGKDSNPHETLRTILSEKKLRSLYGRNCFSASPLTAITNFFNVNTNKTGRPLYHPYGIGFSRDILVSKYSAKNVIYVDENEDKFIPQELRWRTEGLNIYSNDFEYLREWRIKGEVFDFSDFPEGDIIVVAPNENSLNDLIVKFDLKFSPIVDYLNGDIFEDWEEEFSRAWKGITVVDAEAKYTNDYAILSSATKQVIGEDLANKLFSSRPL